MEKCVAKESQKPHDSIQPDAACGVLNPKPQTHEAALHLHAGFYPQHITYILYIYIVYTHTFDTISAKPRN